MSNKRRGLMLVISSPSGAGKSTLCRMLVEEFPEIVLSISATTRGPRPGEKEGREYYFLSRDEFEKRQKQGAFIESAHVHENRYGTPRDEVMGRVEAGRDVLFDIDWQGARQIKDAAGDDVVRIFVLPPSMKDLSNRLHARAQDSEDVIQRRLGRAQGEIERWDEYDYVLVNEVLPDTYAQLRVIYQAERLRRQRQPWLSKFIDDLLDEKL